MQWRNVPTTATGSVPRTGADARKTRVLYGGDIEVARAQFASVAPQLHLISLSSVLGPPADGTSAQAASGADVALIDCGSPAMDARAILEGLRTRHVNVPVVLALDPAAAEDTTRIARELGADDYTVKSPGWLARLPSRLDVAVRGHRRAVQLGSIDVAQRRLRSIVESAPVCLARVRVDGTILAMNAAAMAMMGAEKLEDVLAKSLESFLGPESQEALRRFLQSVCQGQPGSLEFPMTAITGTERIAVASAVPLAADSKGNASVLLALHDVTDRRRFEQSVIDNTPAQTGIDAAAAAALEGQLVEALEECRRLTADRDALRAAADEGRADHALLEETRAALAAAEQRLRELTHERHALATERDELQGSLADLGACLEGQLAQRAAENEALAARIRDVDTERTRVAAECRELHAMLEESRAQHEGELAHARVAREGLEQQIRDLEEERRGFAAREDSRATALTASLTECLRESETERSLLDAARHEAQAALGASRAECADLRAALETAAAERAELSGHLATERTRHDALQADLAAARMRQAELHVDIESARVRQTELQIELELARTQHRDALAGWDLERAQRGAQNSEVRSARESLEHQVRETATALEAARADVNHLRRTLETTGGERDDLQRALEELRANQTVHLDETTAARGAIERQLAMREADCSRLSDECSALRRELEAMTGERDLLRRTLDEQRLDHTVRLDETSAAREALEQQLAARERDCSRLSVEYADLARALEATAAERDELRRALGDLRMDHTVRLDETSAARRALEDQLTALEPEHTRLVGECAELRHALETVGRERDQLRCAVDELRLGQDELRLDHTVRLDQLAAARGALEEQLTARDRERTRLVAECGELRRALETTSGERDQLRRAVDELGVEHTARVDQIAATRGALEAQLTAREHECHRLAAECDNLQRALESEREANARAAAAPPVPDTTSYPNDGLEAARASLREAFELVAECSELHNALEETRTQHPRVGDDRGSRQALEEQLRDAEARCERLAAERAERDTTVRALEAELALVVELRKAQRKELIRALEDSAQKEQLADQRLADCHQLQQVLQEAQAALQELSELASSQKTRLHDHTRAGGNGHSAGPATRLRGRSTGRQSVPSGIHGEDSWS